ncbi:hypothetical protein FRUB_05892 [Fimbriiglobus ruber]|uniref:Uncharacterized protein n=1 Tax=Fimbriiglobus ruber TaxID=1908690 RepID=A0A225DQ70_9BACT|nr:hypothetical protein FRUB_05892 [Fimbriiglobus ruber]
MRERKTQGDPPIGDGSDSPGERLVRGQPCGLEANVRRQQPDRGAREKPLVRESTGVDMRRVPNPARPHWGIRAGGRRCGAPARARSGNSFVQRLAHGRSDGILASVGHVVRNFGPRGESDPMIAFG